MLKENFLPRAEIKNQEQFCLSLESIVKVDDERMFGVREDISFSFRISNEVLSHDPLLAENLHGI